MANSSVFELQILREEKEYLENLNKEIWAIRSFEFTPNMSGSTVNIPSPCFKRILTKKEFDNIVEILNNYKMPITLYCSNFGFSYGFTVWTKPFSREEKPTRIISFNSEHVPEKYIGGKGKERNDDMLWEFMYDIFNSQDNITLLKSYDLEIPKYRSYYEY
jgi:hypothetical protein